MMRDGKEARAQDASRPNGRVRAPAKDCAVPSSEEGQQGIHRIDDVQIYAHIVK